ncbi:MAG: hypothetical protein SOZ01_11250 [Selenomonadaceae bacterium]|nr:hypothetical protein [Selenomonadaceae bacterium]
MRTDKLLCISIPTYNRAAVLEQKLEHELPICAQLGIDVYVYDSSTEQDTQELCEGYQQRRLDNLYYVAVAADVPSNDKIYRIWREGAQAGYQYVWMINDHMTCIDAQGLQYILQCLRGGADFYLLHMQAQAEAVQRYADLNAFFQEAAWRLNGFGTAILRTEHFLEGTDWSYYRQKYVRQPYMNYSQIGYYFERLAELAAPQIAEIRLPRAWFVDFWRHERPAWDADTIRICTECWCRTLLALPAVYRHKVAAIRTQDKWFLARFKLLQYRQEHLYGLKLFLRYGRYFYLLHGAAVGHDFLIALLPYAWSRKLYYGRLLALAEQARAAGQPLYVYGAGRHGMECAQLLQALNIEFQGFLVTSLHGNPRGVLRHPVQEAECVLTKETPYVIIAVLTSGAAEVATYLRQLNPRVPYASFDALV